MKTKARLKSLLITLISFGVIIIIGYIKYKGTGKISRVSEYKNKNTFIKDDELKSSRYGNEIIDLIQSLLMLFELDEFEEKYYKNNDFVPDLDKRKIIAERVNRVALFLNVKSSNNKSDVRSNSITNEYKIFSAKIFSRESALLELYSNTGNLSPQGATQQCYELKKSIEMLEHCEKVASQNNISINYIVDLEKSMASRLTHIAERISKKYNNSRQGKRGP